MLSALEEHAVMLRMWGRLQAELSTQAQQHARERERMGQEVVRLRASLVVMRTAVLWGMGLGAIHMTSAPRSQRPRPPSPQQTFPAADEVLCQTACVGHAHHWLQADEACARTGAPCHRVAHPDNAPTPAQAMRS